MNKTATDTATQANSISELELCVRWSKCPRSLLNFRKAGKVPAFFILKRQIRYLLSDVIAFEQLPKLTKIQA
jgi:hypothetical protein